jgi:uncharacterized protein with PIN domain
MNILLKLGLLIFLFINTSQLFSQDLFIYKNGDELEVKVLRINKTDISYKKSSNINGPEYIEDKNNIFMIKYKNGTKDIFNTRTEKVKNINVSQDSNCKHQTDSVMFINNKYMIVCKDCNKKVRYATQQEVKSNIPNNTNGVKANNIGCGEKPIAPPTFNNPQYKQKQPYRDYRKALRQWNNCMGN